MTSQEQLIAWMGDDGPRQNLAAWAEQSVSSQHPTLDPGTEQFYALVLAEALTSGK